MTLKTDFSPKFVCQPEGHQFRHVPLDYFAARGSTEELVCKRLALSTGNPRAIIRFEQLIGLTEQEIFGNRNLSPKAIELVKALFAAKGYVLEAGPTLAVPKKLAASSSIVAIPHGNPDRPKNNNDATVIRVNFGAPRPPK